ncbi:MAG: hypothetical protein ACYS76_16495 [Planctomycetota bacterium]|jgi:hypothetical protein
MNFKPPNSAERLRAIGPTDALEQNLRKALDPAGFEPIPVPNPGDWLAVHRETGQTFHAFVKSKPNRPEKKRNKIYLQPLGEFPESHAPPVDALKQYAAAYFAMPIDVLPTLALNHARITTRINSFTRKRQILTGDVLDILKNNLPDDAFCLLAARPHSESESAFTVSPVTTPPSTEKNETRITGTFCCGEAAKSSPTRPATCSACTTAYTSGAS